jgi:hypothetical protein
MWEWIKKFFGKQNKSEVVILTIGDVKYLHDLRKIISVDIKKGIINIDLPEDWKDPNVPLNIITYDKVQI